MSQYTVYLIEHEGQHEERTWAAVAATPSAAWRCVRQGWLEERDEQPPEPQPATDEDEEEKP